MGVSRQKASAKIRYDDTAMSSGRALSPILARLVGAFSTVYANQTFVAANQSIPGMTLGIFRFSGSHGVKGTFLPNVGGRVRGEISFEGTYTLFRETGTGVRRGIITILLPGLPTPTPPAVPELFPSRIAYIMRTDDELDWVVLGSDDMERVVVAGGKMLRIDTIPFDLPGDDPTVGPGDLDPDP